MSNKPAYTREAALNDLWDALVRPLATDEAFNADKRIVAMNALSAIAEELAKANDIERRLMLTARGAAIWSLLANELVPWLPQAVSEAMLPAQLPTGQTSRAHLLAALGVVADADIPPTHRFAIDPVVLTLSRETFLELKTAFAALHHGEVQTLVAPNATGKHDDAWTWDQQRIRAVQHVLFLHGQGVTKQVAQSRVAASMGVRPETIKSWETSLRSKPSSNFDVAKRAGALALQIEQSEDRHGPMDAGDLAMAEELKREDLKTFGTSYKKRFGRRHNP